MTQKLMMLLVAGLIFCGCPGSEYADIFEGRGTMLTYDGENTIGNFNLDEYALQADFWDGTSLVYHTVGGHPVDSLGNFAFRTEDLDFYGIDQDFTCYDVCVEYDEWGYCTYYATECDTYTYTYDLDVNDVYATYATVTWYDYNWFTSPAVAKDSGNDFWTDGVSTIYRDDYFFTPYDTYSLPTANFKPFKASAIAKIIPPNKYKEFIVYKDSLKNIGEKQARAKLQSYIQKNGIDVASFFEDGKTLSKPTKIDKSLLNSQQFKILENFRNKKRVTSSK